MLLTRKLFIKLDQIKSDLQGCLMSILKIEDDFNLVKLRVSKYFPLQIHRVRDIVPAYKSRDIKHRNLRCNFKLILHFSSGMSDLMR